MSLWEGFKIPVICVAGEPGSGKTLFGLTVDPGCFNFTKDPSTLVWDTEGSSVSYEGSLNFDRIDIPREVLKAKPGGYSSLDLFNFWQQSAERIPPEKYKVLVLDTVTEIEDGLVDYVKSNPSKFGYTQGQFIKMEGLMWGVVKREWKRLIMMLSNRCETLVLTAHMRDEFKGSQPTGRRLPRVKETVMSVTSLYLILSRQQPARKKAICVVPSAIVKKSRLLFFDKATGNRKQVLPPCLPDASPDGIRKYLKKPVDTENLKISERAVPKPEVTEEEKMALQAEIAHYEAERAQADLSRAELERMIQLEKVGSETPPIPLEQKIATKPATKEPQLINDKDAQLLKTFTLEHMQAPQAKKLLQSRYNVGKIAELTVEQATDLRKHLESLGN